MPSWGSYSFLFGPLLALAVIGLLLWFARRTTGGQASLIERPGAVGAAEEYGLMIPVADPPDRPRAEELVGRLVAAGVRARAVPTADGLRVMVWAEDVARARSLLDPPRR